MTDLVDRLGSTVGGKYRIAKFLAAGGMGAVYEALHVVVKRRFAVKFLRADLALRRDVLERFQREAEAAGALESENIAAAVDFGIAADGAPYIVMEYLAGVDLARLLAASGPLPVERAADLVLQACRGIHEAHAAGVIHRDLKPENLFVCQRSDGSDLVKIVDFGIAKLQASDAGSAVTGTGGMVGTPSYMSPEQARGEAIIDQRSDLYSLGVVLYELLSGRVPHPGDSYNAVIYHISTQSPVPLVCEHRELPRGLVEVVHRALSPERADRHESAEQFAEALTAFAQRVIWPSLVDHTTRFHDPDLRRPPEPGDHELDVSSTGSTQAAAAPERKFPRGRTAWVVAIGLAISLALLLGVRGMARQKPEAHQKSDPDNSSVRAPIRNAALAPGLVNERRTPVESTAGVPAAPSLEEHVRPGVPISATRPGRPSATRGRPKGRPAPSTVAEQTPPRAQRAGASSGQATFDTRNPYE